MGRRSYTFLYALENYRLPHNLTIISGACTWLSFARISRIKRPGVVQFEPSVCFFSGPRLSEIMLSQLNYLVAIELISIEIGGWPRNVVLLRYSVLLMFNEIILPVFSL